jgi:hypothetical protein
MRSQKENRNDRDIPPCLRTEMTNFIKFLSAKSIPIGKIQSSDESDESYCISALRLIRRGMSLYLKKSSEMERWVGVASTAPPKEIVEVGQNGKNDTKRLKSKMVVMMQKMRIEKESGQRHLEELQLIKKRLISKSDHIERLMNHLKIEATSKLKIIEHLRVSERSNRKLIEKNSATSKDSVANDHLILELREGDFMAICRILFSHSEQHWNSIIVTHNFLVTTIFDFDSLLAYSSHIRPLSHSDAPPLI